MPSYDVVDAVGNVGIDTPNFRDTNPLFLEQLQNNSPYGDGPFNTDSGNYESPVLNSK